MSVETLITLIVLGSAILVSLITIVVAIIRGDMKKYIIAQMEEAEKSGLSGKEKLQFVIDRVKEKYKVLELVLNVKKFVEEIISITKQINYKK